LTAAIWSSAKSRESLPSNRFLPETLKLSFPNLSRKRKRLRGNTQEDAIVKSHPVSRNTASASNLALNAQSFANAKAARTMTMALPSESGCVRRPQNLNVLRRLNQEAARTHTITKVKTLFLQLARGVTRFEH
jgi:hypothetical protein